MSNHVHLLLQTGEVEPGSIMKRINMRYTQYINMKYDLVGHLFQGRYGAERIKDESGMIVVSRYIHLNPVKAGMVARPESYAWSSYRAFLGKEQNGLVAPQRIIRHIGGIEPYEAYVLASKDMEC
jgi:hypothetical protein